MFAYNVSKVNKQLKVFYNDNNKMKMNFYVKT